MTDLLERDQDSDLKPLDIPHTEITITHRRSKPTSQVWAVILGAMILSVLSSRGCDYVWNKAAKEAMIADNEAFKTKMSQMVAEMEKKIDKQSAAVATSIEGLTTRVGEIEAKLATFAQKAETAKALKTINERLSLLAESANALISGLSSIKKSDFQAQIDNILEDIQGPEDSLEGEAEIRKEINTLKAKVETLERLATQPKIIVEPALTIIKPIQTKVVEVEKEVIVEKKTEPIKAAQECPDHRGHGGATQNRRMTNPSYPPTPNIQPSRVIYDSRGDVMYRGR